MDVIYKDSAVVLAIKPAGVLSTDEPGGMPELLRAAGCSPSSLGYRGVPR